MHLVDNNYIRTKGNGSTWHVEFDLPRRPLKSFYEETVIAAEMIWANKTGKIQLCYSGGLDSEFVLGVFLKLGMNVETVIMKTQYNFPEVNYAFKFCEANNIKPTIIDLDYDKFVESGEFLRIASDMKCAAWQIPPNMWLAGQLDDTVITGDSNPHLRLYPDNKWYLEEREVFHSQFNYWKNNNIQGTPFFLSYTPEMFWAFVSDTTMYNLCNNKIPGKQGSHSSKVNVYNKNSDFNLEPRKKLHGYELVELSSIFNHNDIKTVNAFDKEWGGIEYFNYHDLILRLTEFNKLVIM
jgi:hypothetical protein